MSLEAKARSPQGPLVVAIYTVGATGAPSVQVGASVEIPLFDDSDFVLKTATFNPPVQVSGGARYAVVLSQTSTKGSQNYEVKLWKNDTYPYGMVWNRDSSGSVWTSMDNRDFAMTVTFACCQSGCTYSHGYWKTHEEAWPVGSLKLGTTTYTKAELLTILKEEVRGNGLVSLSHQLIAAKLNVIIGANPSALGTAIADADLLIGALVVPPVGSGNLPPSSTGDLNTKLDNFNNGALGAVYCPN